MTTVRLIDEQYSTGEVGQGYAEICSVFGLSFVPNMFKVMAPNPIYLKASWEWVKVVMGPGLINRKTKEMIAVALSAVNGGDYCVSAHTATLKGMGCGDAEIVELMSVVDLFSDFNKLLVGLQATPDLEVSAS